MKNTLRCFAVMAAWGVSHSARGESAVEATVSNIPANATEVLFFLDTTTPAEAPSYEEPAPPPPPADPAIAIPAAAGQLSAADPAAAAPALQRRRRSGGSAAKPPPSILGAVKTQGATSLTWRTPTPPADKYRVRAVAVTGDGTFPLVLAGGKSVALKVVADQVTTATVHLAAPTLKFAAENPSAVAPGSKFKLAGTLTDPGSFLGTKNRMRVWWSAGTPPAENRAGTQGSTVDVSTKGEEITFAFELTAPREPGPLYLQFGEVSNDFNRPDGKQVPFLVWPDLAHGAPLKLQVGPLAAQP